MKEFYRRHLPHWQPRNAIFFVTFRLKDSLPIEVIKLLKEDWKREGKNHFESRRYFDKWDAYLDKSEFGPHWLSQPKIADIVKEALHYCNGNVFDLHAFCIMSNHVHVVFKALSESESHREVSRSGWQLTYLYEKSCNRLNSTPRGRQTEFSRGKVLFGRMKVMTM